MAYQSYGTLEVKNVETLDCGMGLTLMTSGGRENNFITLRDSVIMGESTALPVDPSEY